MTQYKYLGVNMTSPPSYDYNVSAPMIEQKINKLFNPVAISTARPQFDMALRAIVAYPLNTRRISNPVAINASLYARLWQGLPEMISRDVMSQPPPSGIGITSIEDIQDTQASATYRTLLQRPHKEWEDLLASIHPALNSFNLQFALKSNVIGPRAVPLPFWKYLTTILLERDPPIYSITRPWPNSWTSWLTEPILINPNITYPSRMTDRKSVV